MKKETDSRDPWPSNRFWMVVFALFVVAPISLAVFNWIRESDTTSAQEVRSLQGPSYPDRVELADPPVSAAPAEDDHE